MTNRPKAGVA